MLELINVKKIYTTKAGDTAALNGLSVTFPEKGLVFVTGNSGSGKTTLLNVVGGLDGIDDGDIVIQGKKFSEFTPEEYNSYRNTFIGFIFQEYNLLSEYTVEKNIRIATELQGLEPNLEDINALLEKVGLEGLNHRLPSELSGGQKQRVAIARALIKNPKIIMADEPTGALDSVTGVQVLETLKELSKERLVLVVSHDLELAERFADRIIRLVDGELVDDFTLTDSVIEGNVAENDKDFIVKSGAELTKEETASLVGAIKDKKNVVLSENITVRKRSKTEYKEETKPQDPVKLVSSKMKYRSSAELGLKSLKVKPLRLAFTILLSVVAFAVFGLFDTIASYDNAKVVANLIAGEEYNAIQLSAEHVGEENKTKLNFSNQEIQRIKRQSGYDFRPIYDINDKTYTGVATNVSITETLYVNSTVGKDYYPRSVSGFVEFSKDEITADGIIDKNSFNYKVVAGAYPTFRYDEEGRFIEDSLYDIAISTFLADGIMYWLEGKPLNGETMTSYEDFVMKGATITLRQQKYKVVGIIDCGVIPEKYDKLRYKIPSRDTAQLADDLEAYVNSGGHLLGFVPEGYVDYVRTKNNRITNYYTNEYRYTLYNSLNNYMSTISDVEDTRFYKSNDISNDNVLLFNKDLFNEDGERIFLENKNILNDDEILIHVDNFRKTFVEEIEALEDDVDFARRFAEAWIIVSSPSRSVRDREEALQDLCKVFEDAKQPIVKYVNLTREAKSSGKATSNVFKIVGVYFGVNTDIGASMQNWHPFAMNANTLNKLGVYSDQGYYSKIIAPLYGRNAGCSAKGGANFIAEYMTKEQGFRLQWYGNTILKSIDQNGKMITDFTGLVLIIAVVLAVFSVFMLFNYISTSIVSKRRSIGVLRALGSNGKDVFSMFITESLVISVINGVLASIVAFIGCIFVNFYIRNIMDMTVDFAIYGLKQVILIMLASIITGVISSLLPIIRICKEKPVDLIRKP